MMAWRDIAASGSPLRRKYDQIAADLGRYLQENRPQWPDLPRDIRALLEHIHENAFEPALTAQSAKASLGLRNHNVSTHFRHVIGLSIREYIESLRLEAADRLLRVEDLEVYLVAMAVGYDHTETFCRAFQRRFGVTPSERRPAQVPGGD
jgi:AraC-like DNA-binding protein